MARRIVLDTNVVVAGIRSRRGASHRLLTLAGTGAFEHCISVGLLFEYEAALSRLGTAGRLPRRAAEDILDYLAGSAHHQKVHYLWRPVLPDPHDDLVLEVAVAAGCGAIVTFNVNDFAGTERLRVRAITPGRFLSDMEL